MASYKNDQTRKTCPISYTLTKITVITNIIKIYIKFQARGKISTAELTLSFLKYDIKLVFTFTNIAVHMITSWLFSVHGER